MFYQIHYPCSIRLGGSFVPDFPTFRMTSFPTLPRTERGSQDQGFSVRKPESPDQAEQIGYPTIIFILNRRAGRANQR